MSETIPQLLREISSSFPEETAQLHKDLDGTFQPTSFSQLYEEVLDFGSGLKSLDIEKGDHLGLVSENRKEWFICNLATLSIGAVDVPRGCDTTQQEIAYILQFSECRTAFAENEAQVEKILGVKGELPDLSRIIVLDP